MDGQINKRMGKNSQDRCARSPSTKFMGSNCERPQGFSLWHVSILTPE